MNLYSRVHRIEFDGGYRDVQIHEMTASEIASLKAQRWTGFIAGVSIAAVVMLVYFSVAVHYACK